MHLCGAIDLQINSAYRSYGSIANAEIIRAQDLKSDYANRFSIDNNKKKRRKPNWKYVVGIYLSIAGLEQNQKTIIFMISIKHDGQRDNR